MPKLLALASLCFLLSMSCSKDKVDNTCAVDADCVIPGTRCNDEKKVCVCSTDEACEEDEFCNRAGSCQKATGCRRNSDCEGEDQLCDLESGRCLEGNPNCGLATHCKQNEICVGDECALGCHDDGDCVLGQVCFDDGNVALCEDQEGLCSDDSYCEYGEQCLGNQCKRDRRGPYCRGCDNRRTFSNPEPCDDPKNYCLINSRERGHFRNYCGVDCSLGQDCPNGYRCGFVVILTQDVCFTNAECQCDGSLGDGIEWATSTCTVSETCVPRDSDGTVSTSKLYCQTPRHLDCNPGGTGEATCIVPKGDRVGFCTCDDDSDCAAGGACVGGQCCTGAVDTSRECRSGEGRVSGYCSCATDTDCPNDNCDGSRGACAITGNPCTPGNGDCGPIPCVNGGCQIGQNCAPIQGLACSEVNPI